MVETVLTGPGRINAEPVTPIDRHALRLNYLLVTDPVSARQVVDDVVGHYPHTESFFNAPPGTRRALIEHSGEKVNLQLVPEDGGWRMVLPVDMGKLKKLSEKAQLRADTVLNCLPSDNPTSNSLRRLNVTINASGETDAYLERRNPRGKYEKEVDPFGEEAQPLREALNASLAELGSAASVAYLITHMTLPPKSDFSPMTDYDDDYDDDERPRFGQRMDELRRNNKAQEVVLFDGSMLKREPTGRPKSAQQRKDRQRAVAEAKKSKKKQGRGRK